MQGPCQPKTPARIVPTSTPGNLCKSCFGFERKIRFNFCGILKMKSKIRKNLLTPLGIIFLASCGQPFLVDGVYNVDVLYVEDYCPSCGENFTGTVSQEEWEISEDHTKLTLLFSIPQVFELEPDPDGKRLRIISEHHWLFLTPQTGGESFRGDWWVEVPTLLETYSTFSGVIR